MVNQLIVDFSVHPGASSTSSRVRSRSPFFDCQEERRHRRIMDKSGQPSSARRRRHSYQPHSSSDPSPTAAARSVRFSEKSLLKLVTKHEERADVSYADLWYTSTDIDHMKFAAVRDVLEARNQIAAGVSTERSTVCLTGIEGRLTQESADEVKACRKRCVLAVLLEQERQEQIMSLSSLFADRHGADMIALASLSQTMKPALRAREIGLRHQEDVMKSSRDHEDNVR